MKTVLVVGGGTAGWLAAGYLSSKGLDVTLVESPQVGIIGVGESTVPAINWIANEMGLSEEEWMPLANATFKLGIKHENWRPDGVTWWHWFLYDRTRQESQMDYVNTHTLPDTDTFEYGYHIDAYKFGETICKTVALKNNCTHIIDHITNVVSDGENIIQVETESGANLSADFYVDCSGFKKILASEIGITYTQYDELINNRAVAASVHDLDLNERYTTTKARTAGWMWQIPLQDRHGCGYVYSDKFLSQEDAIKEFMQEYPSIKRENVKTLKFTPEVANESIKGNVAVAGLSGGFIEPLEATSVFLTYLQIRQAWFYINGERSAKVLNKNIVNVFNETKNFVLAHYTLSGKTDTPYWQYYKNLEEQINTKDMVLMQANKPDYGKWRPGVLFQEYSWWSMAHYFNLL